MVQSGSRDHAISISGPVSKSPLPPACPERVRVSQSVTSQPASQIQRVSIKAKIRDVRLWPRERHSDDREADRQMQSSTSGSKLGTLSATCPISALL